MIDELTRKQGKLLANRQMPVSTPRWRNSAWGCRSSWRADCERSVESALPRELILQAHFLTKYIRLLWFFYFLFLFMFILLSCGFQRFFSIILKSCLLCVKSFLLCFLIYMGIIVNVPLWILISVIYDYFFLFDQPGQSFINFIKLCKNRTFIFSLLFSLFHLIACS